MPEDTRKIATIGHAFQWFTYFALQKKMAYPVLEDGCHSRTHIMCQTMIKAGFTPKKLWIASKLEGSKQQITLRAMTNETVHLDYHVLPCLEAMDPSGKKIILLIDPAFFDRPIPLETFMQHTSATKFAITEVGAPPPGYKNGDGFSWHHSRRTLKSRDKAAKEILEDLHKIATQEKMPVPPWIHQIRQNNCLWPRPKRT